MTRQRTNPLIYQAIVDAYQRALIDLLRRKLSEQDVTDVFKPEAVAGFFVRASEVGHRPADVYGALDLPNANRVVAHHSSRLIPRSAYWTEADQLRLKANLRRVVEARHWVSHTTDSLPRDRAMEAVEAGLQILKTIGARSRQLESFRSQLRQRRPTSRSQLRQPMPTAKALLGRQRDVDALSALLKKASGQIVSLCGEGGIGKTSLALEVAHKSRRVSLGVTIWTSLAEESAWGTALLTIARNVSGRRGKQSTNLISEIAERLAAKRTLLVLDNLEHLLGEARDDLSRLAIECGDSHVLVTSRESLGLGNELVYRLDGLPFPGHDDSLGDLQSSPSVALFVERATASNNRFRPAERELRRIGELCRRVQGVPLAIELLASSMADRTIAEVADEWGRLLDEVRVGRPRRQASMQTSFLWSWTQLSNTQKQVLMQLSLLWPASMQSIVVACAGELGPDATRDAVYALVRKSLVRVGGNVYDLHPLVRRYATDQCSDELSTATWRAMLGRASAMLRRAKGDFTTESDLPDAFLHVLGGTESLAGLDEELADLWLASSDHWEQPEEPGLLGPYVLARLKPLTYRMTASSRLLAPALIRATWLATIYGEDLYGACAAVRALSAAARRGEQQHAVEAARWINSITFGWTTVFVTAGLRELKRASGTRLAAAAASHLTPDWWDALTSVAENEPGANEALERFDFSLALRARSVAADLWLAADDREEARQARAEVELLLGEAPSLSGKLLDQLIAMFKRAGDVHGHGLAVRKRGWQFLGMAGEVDPRDLIRLHKSGRKGQPALVGRLVPTTLEKAEKCFLDAQTLEPADEGLIGLSYVYALQQRFDDAWDVLSRLRDIPERAQSSFEYAKNLRWAEMLWTEHRVASPTVVRGVIGVVMPLVQYLANEDHGLSAGKILHAARRLVHSIGDRTLSDEFATASRAPGRKTRAVLDASERRLLAKTDRQLQPPELVADLLKIAVHENAREERRRLRNVVYIP